MTYVCAVCMYRYGFFVFFFSRREIVVIGSDGTDRACTILVFYIRRSFVTFRISNDRPKTRIVFEHQSGACVVESKSSVSAPNDNDNEVLQILYNIYII